MQLLWAHAERSLSCVQNAIVLNEFTADRWNAPYQYNTSMTIGQATLQRYGFRQHRIWVWLAIAITIVWLIGLNILCVYTLKWLDRALLACLLCENRSC